MIAPSETLDRQRGQFLGPSFICSVDGQELEVTSTVLKCPMGHSHPIVDEIPRFVPHSTYANAFGLQWKRYRVTQLDSYTGTSITKDRLRRCLGNALWPDLKGLQVLEAGCGAGRFTEHLLARGACVTSVDLTDAVEANRENFPVTPSHRVAQADILHLPFAPRQFDRVICLGVLQHTPDPAKAISALWEQVRPGGWLVIDHYTFEWGWATKMSPVLRQILKRLSRERGLMITEKIVRTMFPVHRWISKAPKPVCWLRPVLTRVSPVQTYFHAYPQLSEKSQLEWSLLDTHDQLTDWYKHRYSPKKICTILTALGGTGIEVWRGGIGIEARMHRPVSSS